MSAQLKMRGHNVGRRKARRYMDEMAIDPIYPKMNLSKRGLYRGLQKGVPCGKASYFKLRPGMPVHQFRLQGLPEGECIRQSMDGKSRWADNILIECWFRTFKYDEAYLTEWHNIGEAREAIAVYVFKYNFERCHSSVGNVPPASVYYPVLLYEAARQASMPEQRLNAAGSAA